DHPAARAACAALDTRTGRAALQPVPPGTPCTDVWGGPQVAHVRGYVDGRRVATAFDRTNGCEIDRWDALAALLDVPHATGPVAQVTVTMYPTGSGRGHRATLECGPTGGDHPRAEAACDALLSAAGQAALPPVPADVLCTQQWEGPEVAHLEGHVGDQKVSTRFSRHNGCEIARWRALAPVLELVPVHGWPSPVPVDR
ncbi:SSI family serine proteinase inhibitor, partial [Cellulomonas bogoriensis]|uniref:SSI family serine proteinase inhibitor n=1 Tax=Cellulomonas bogoriensis TaxID=301388 RepID=UPI0009FFC99B